MHGDWLQLHGVASERAGLLELWEERRAEFEQCMQLQLYMRDAEQTDNWMAKQEVGVARKLAWSACKWGCAVGYGAKPCGGTMKTSQHQIHAASIYCSVLLWLFVGG